MKFKKTATSIHAIGASLGALIVFVSLFLASCSQKALSVFLDVPPPDPESELQETTEAAEPAPDTAGNSSTSNSWFGTHPSDMETDRPPIEDTLVWEEALELLPTNKKGEPDWSAALREGIIKPRALDPADRRAEWFALDFYMQADKPKFDAWFPHSSHVAWMGCDSCHPVFFEYRDNDITMKKIRTGEYCGACHGKVAFTAKDCKRCHTKM